MDMENLDINAQKLKAALAQLEQTSRDNANANGDKTIAATNGEAQPAHKNALKSPRLKTRKSIEKGTDEYIVKRERNNVAVRKSRTKAKLKHIETQMRVGELTEENEQLRNRVASLQKELNALKSFISYNCPQCETTMFLIVPTNFLKYKDYVKRSVWNLNFFPVFEF